VYLEVGRFALPQVPASRFDETKEVVAYVVGLFVGVPLALLWVFFLSALSDAALPAALIDVVLLVVGADVAQYVLQRSHYFGNPSAVPFYALGMRAGIGGLLAIGGLSQYFGGRVDGVGSTLAALQAVAVVLIEAAVGLRLFLPTSTSGEVVRRRVATLVLAILLFGLAGLGSLYGATLGLFGAVVAIGGSAFLYWEARGPVLVATAPRAARPPSATGRYGRVGKPETKRGRP
jgi:hypothetical protein